MTPLLELKSLRLVYPPGFVALDNLCLHVGPGETLAVVGQSGSGKTTLARVAAGLLKPTSGQVLLHGQDRYARRPQYRPVQMIFQEPLEALTPTMTVSQLIAEPLQTYHGLRGPELRRQTMALLEEVLLEPALLPRRPAEISGGQRQRVSLARALAPQPDLLVADEPLSALDALTRASILSLLADLPRRRGIALLLVTHDLAAVEALAHRIVVLLEGRIVETMEGPPLSLHHPYTRALWSSLPRLPGQKAPSMASQTRFSRGDGT